MGRAMRIFAVVLLLAVAQAVVHDEGPITAKEINEMIIPALEQAQAPLKEVLAIESAEEHEMHDISSSVNEVEQSGDVDVDGDEIKKRLFNVARAADTDTRKAIEGEERQQNLALKSLKQAKHMVDMFHQRGVHVHPQPNSELGEVAAGSLSPMQKALSNLEEVEKSLERDTATSHTMERIKHMKDEADRVMAMEEMHAASPANPYEATTLGEARGNAVDDLLGAASYAKHGEPITNAQLDAAQAASPKPTTAASPETADQEMTKLTAGAIDNLKEEATLLEKTSAQKAPAAANSDQDSAIKTLDNLKQEEVSIENAERADEKEISRLSNLLD